MSLLDGYRKNWPRVGALLGMGIAGATVLASRKLPRAQALAAANFAALTVHQYEEYEDPGYFPGQFNAGVLHSDKPDRYPLNTNTALIVNVPLAYTFYALPIVFPRNRVLGIAPVMFGFLQAAGHGTIFPRLAGDRYSPGFLASALLHVPIGSSYLRAIHAEAPLKRSELAKAAAYNFAFAVTSIAGPNLLLKQKDSPYRFTAKQMGPHRTDPHPLDRG
ncbi:MAG TPA: HXXEE domain-containing protein [Thermoleophilaceae bacterium]|nr:HXXEE domain-containing protein [Thermoleophilaceae bacterium]